MAGNAGQHIDAGIAVDAEVNLHRPQGDGAVGGERKGGAAQLGRVNAEQQVVHDGIANEGGFQNVLRRDAGLRRHVRCQGVQGLAHNSGHFLLTARVHHHIGHPAHQVFAKADLRVHQAGRGHHLARG